MALIKQFFKKYLATFIFFYGYLGRRTFILLTLSMLVALFDSFGLTMFIPLLGKATVGTVDYSSQMGQLSLVVDVLKDMGLNFTLGGVLLLIAILFTIKGVLRYFEDYYRVRLRLVFMKGIRYQLIDKLADVRFTHFANSNAGMIQNNMTVEVNQVIMAFEHYFRVAQGFVMIFIYLSLAFVASPQFAFMVLVAGLISNLLYQRIFRFTKSLSREVTHKGHVFHNFLVQNVNNFKYLKATGRVKKYTRKLKEKISEIENAQLRIGKLNAILFGSRETVATIIVILVIFVKVSLMGGLITAMLLSLMFFYRALGAVLSVQNNWNLYLGNSGSIESLQEFIKDLDDNKESNGHTNNSVKFSNLEVKDLSFSYRENVGVLSKINLKISAGETVAIVGESGSGKTTLMNLIAGLLQGYEGQILVDGNELKELDKMSWHKQLGYITQEPVIFDDTIANNITFWDDLSDPNNKLRMEEAMSKAAISEFVGSLENKEQTGLGYNGILVSGGQKQRISIARELYKADVELLIMDEATSSLDSETEKIIQDNVLNLHGTCAMLIIAHRLTTVKNADRIILMHNGQIEQEGSFLELLESSERFKEMVELQEF